MNEAFLKNLPLVSSTAINGHFTIRGVKIGGPVPVVIAGPCAVESAEQILTIAEYVKSLGVKGLRGGVFKPRSSPYSFQGLGEKGLEYLAQARERTGLFTVIEVTSSEQITAVTDFADVIQIGARNMQNFELLKAVGRRRKPVLLKRGLSATIQELLQAAEYILYEGSSMIILCERGIRTFETSTRNTLDINAIPLLKQLTKLPVFADPSHGTGRSDLVIPVAKAALSAGADGLIIEVHPNPERALSDGNQSLDFHSFKRLIGELKIKSELRPVPATPQTTPGLQQFQKMIAENDYDYIPVQTELLTDAETPVTAFLKMAAGPGRFLLESVDRGEQVGRFSFIGWEPLAVFQARGNEVEYTDAAGTEKYRVADTLAELEARLRGFKVAPAFNPAKFFGGAVGYIGYDYVRIIEKLPAKNRSIAALPDLYWVIPKYLACFDHVSHKITLSILAKVDGGAIEESYRKAAAELAGILCRLQEQLELPALDSLTPAKTPLQTYSLSKAEYEAGVAKIKEYIYAGDAFQVVLSQRISQPFESDPFLFYRLLRTINPSPYLFYLDFGQFQIAGSSPEVMVRLEDREAVLKPIAGTRPRGANPLEDRKLREELLNDEKERAEHIMLVDLGRNDLGRVCKFGSVKVTELMNIENYSHVMHIVSTIRGELLPEYSAVDLLRAVFPAGTLSGAPKVRAMEIIEEIEPSRRGLYGGAVGYLGFNGNMDTCITIRTVLFQDHQAHLQVGAGIVADSEPEKEYQETLNKAGALLAALNRTGV
ncbi:MAG: anthranilate synthase component I [Bacillota bacterium]